MLASFPAFSLAESKSDQDPSYEDSEAYRVYSVLIPKDWIWTNAKAESLVIAAQTVSSELCLKPEDESAAILAPAMANYKELAAKRWNLTRKFDLSKPYTLVDRQELDSYFSKGINGWNDFYAKYPKSGGYLALSPVGFNPDKDVAIVEVDHRCGGLCGGGGFSVLQKQNGEWKNMKWKGSSCVWAS